MREAKKQQVLQADRQRGRTGPYSDRGERDLHVVQEGVGEAVDLIAIGFLAVDLVAHDRHHDAVDRALVAEQHRRHRAPVVGIHVAELG